MITVAPSLNACLACNRSLLSASLSVIWKQKCYELCVTNFRFLLLVYEEIREECHDINFLEFESSLLASLHDQKRCPLSL